LIDKGYPKEIAFFYIEKILVKYWIKRQLKSPAKEQINPRHPHFVPVARSALPTCMCL